MELPDFFPCFISCLSTVHPLFWISMVPELGCPLCCNCMYPSTQPLPLRVIPLLFHLPSIFPPCSRFKTSPIVQQFTYSITRSLNYSETLSVTPEMKKMIGNVSKRCSLYLLDSLPLLSPSVRWSCLLLWISTSDWIFVRPAFSFTTKRLFPTLCFSVLFWETWMS